MHLEDLLTALGHEVVGQATRIDMAMELARKSDIDFAVLDINVAGTKSFPVADILRQRGIPFAFATGYGAEGLMDGYRDFPALQKPYAQEDLERTIARFFAMNPDDMIPPGSTAEGVLSERPGFITSVRRHGKRARGLRRKPVLLHQVAEFVGPIQRLLAGRMPITWKHLTRRSPPCSAIWRQNSARSLRNRTAARMTFSISSNCAAAMISAV
jgi:CheY-like chemotaxis protein